MDVHIQAAVRFAPPGRQGGHRGRPPSRPSSRRASASPWVLFARETARGWMTRS